MSPAGQHGTVCRRAAFLGFFAGFLPVLNCTLTTPDECLNKDLTCGPSTLALAARQSTLTPVFSIFESGSNSVAAGTTRDLGSVGRGTGGTYKDLTLTISNPGGLPLEITNVTLSPSGQYTITSAPASTVLPGGSTTMTIRYIPSAGASDSAVLTLATNDPANPSFSLSLTGAGVTVSGGLTFYYPLDGSLTDMSGNGINGVVVGSIGYTTGRHGQPNTAVALDGTGTNYFQGSPATGWAWNSTYSVVGWVFTNQSSFAFAFRSFAGVCTSQFEFGFNGTNYQIMRDNFSCGGWTSTLVSGPRQAATWEHLAFVSNAGTISVYRNGVLLGSGAVAAGPGAGGLPIGFGRTAFAGAILGAIDDIRVYNATALTPAQIQALYNQD